MDNQAGSKWKPFFVTTLLLLAASLSNAQTNIERELAAVVDGMVLNYYKPAVVTAFGSFTYGYTGLGSSYSRYLEDILTRAISQCHKVTLFARHAVSNMDPSFKELYSDYFKTTGVEGLLYGTFFEEGKDVRVRLEMTSLTIGEVIGTAEVTIPKSLIPAGVTITPPGLTQASDLRNEIEHLLGSSAGNLVVKVTTSRGEGGVYKDGERMVVYVFVNQDAYIKVYHIDVNGRLALIFPNKFYSHNRIQGGEFVQIPGADHPFQFVLHAPFGTEFIKAAAALSQFEDIEVSFSELGPAGKATLSRGMSVMEASADRAEALAAYSIVAP
ncbi:MAG: DUF4384 domain-containing protein [Spirochaetota bacterium]